MLKHVPRQYPSTYFVENRSSQEDLARLHIQDDLVTTAMGGVLPEQQEIGQLCKVLDVGCGTGGWLIKLAKFAPLSTLLIGIDSSTQMIDVARQQATLQLVQDRVEFHAMDALRLLEFPTAFFDLVNQRSGISYLRTWDWPRLIQEYLRVTRSGGIIRISEGEWAPENNSPALNQLFTLLIQAFYEAGHSFKPERDGVTSHLIDLLEHQGTQQVQSRLITSEYRAGANEWQAFVEEIHLTFRVIVPFLRKWTRVPDDYDELYLQAMREMNAPDFVATGRMLTVWGVKGN